MSGSGGSYEIDQQDRVPDDDPCKSDEADHRGGREGCVEQDVAHDNTNQCQGDGGENNQGKSKASELRDHENVNPQNSHGERCAHIPERHIGDLPLSVPEQRTRALVLRLTIKAHSRLREIAPVMAINRRLNIQHAVNGSFVGARQLPHHHFRVATVAPEYGVLAQLITGINQFSKLYKTSAICAGCDGKGFQALRPCSHGVRQAN